MLKVLLQCLLIACGADKKSDSILSIIPSWVTCFFPSLRGFRIFSLSFELWNFIRMCLDVNFFPNSPVWDSVDPSNSKDLSLQLRKFLYCLFCYRFLTPVSVFCTPTEQVLDLMGWSSLSFQLSSQILSLSFGLKLWELSLALYCTNSVLATSMLIFQPSAK